MQSGVVVFGTEGQRQQLPEPNIGSNSSRTKLTTVLFFRSVSVSMIANCFSVFSPFSELAVHDAAMHDAKLPPPLRSGGDAIESDGESD